MVLEVAVLHIKEGLAKTFENAFAQASPLISEIKGYISHELKKCVENKNQYLLLVHWETLEDHEIGFRQSAQYVAWKALLHRFYEPFPTVLHYT